MTKRIAWLVAVATLCVASNTTAQATAPRDSIIYAMVVDTLLATSSQRTFVLKSEAKPGFVGLSLRNGIPDQLATTPSLDSSAINDFKAATAEGRRIPVMHSEHFTIKMADDSTLTRVISMSPDGGTRNRPAPDEYWNRIHATYGPSTGVISMTAIGYSKDGKQALMFVDYGCGPLCGRGNKVLLQKTDGVWRIVAMTRTWIS